MILYSLRCDAGHEVEAWFRDGAAYERQHARGQVTCPECGSRSVEKAPMAPRVARSREAAPPAPTVPPQQPPPTPSPPSPAQLRQALQLLRRHVEANCEHVGPGFAEEARKIHRGEAKPRGIYGDATEAESRALTDEGIEVARIPWVPSSDA